MTDKVQKIREGVEIVINRRLNLLNGDYFDLNKEADGFTNEIMDIINSLQEEPVSEDLEEAAYHNCIDRLSKKSIEDFKAGAKWQKEHLWKTADGEDLPEIDREVIALVQDYPNDKDHLRVAFVHRPSGYIKVWNPDIGEEQVVEIEGYDKSGWNIPNVKYWLDCSMPKEIEL